MTLFPSFVGERYLKLPYSGVNWYHSLLCKIPIAFEQKSWSLCQDFNYGVEFMLLISFLETASREAMEDASSSLQKLISQCSSFIVQATCGKTAWYPYGSSVELPTLDHLYILLKLKANNLSILFNIDCY